MFTVKETIGLVLVPVSILSAAIGGLVLVLAPDHFQPIGVGLLMLSFIGVPIASWLL